MDSWELNKILGALLGVLTFAVGLGLISEALFEPETPKKPGFSVEVAAASPAGQPAQQAAADPPVETLLPKANPSHGQQLFKACQACHTIEKGGPNRVGPNLWGVLGGKKAHMPDFNYSAAMKAEAAKGEPWTFAAIYQFIKKPSAFIPGTAMGFAGLPKPQDRADVIAYLNSQSDKPLPLPH